jgi:hypothetical protein
MWHICTLVHFSHFRHLHDKHSPGPQLPYFLRFIIVILFLTIQNLHFLWAAAAKVRILGVGADTVFCAWNCLPWRGLEVIEEEHRRGLPFQVCLQFKLFVLSLHESAEHSTKALCSNIKRLA